MHDFCLSRKQASLRCSALLWHMRDQRDDPRGRAFFVADLSPKALVGARRIVDK